MIRRPPRSTLFPYTPLSRSAYNLRRSARWLAHLATSLHDNESQRPLLSSHEQLRSTFADNTNTRKTFNNRSEEHTSELQSQSNLVCRLLLEKKKKTHTPDVTHLLSSTSAPPCLPSSATP